MKNKLLALLAALLLSVSLLPAQALAASDPEPGDPENPIVPYSAPLPEEPGFPDRDH